MNFRIKRKLVAAVCHYGVPGGLPRKIKVFRSVDTSDEAIQLGVWLICVAKMLETNKRKPARRGKRG